MKLFLFLNVTFNFDLVNLSSYLVGPKIWNRDPFCLLDLLDLSQLNLKTEVIETINESECTYDKVPGWGLVTGSERPSVWNHLHIIKCLCSFNFSCHVLSILVTRRESFYLFRKYHFILRKGVLKVQKKNYCQYHLYT